MIFIAMNFSIRPEVADQWLARVAPFTAATRAEPGNLFFEWSRRVDTPNQLVLLQTFRDRAASEAHVHSEHSKRPWRGCPTLARSRQTLATSKRPATAGRPWRHCTHAPRRDAPRHRSVTRRP